jgi:hypothetical protein
MQLPPFPPLLLDILSQKPHGLHFHVMSQYDVWADLKISVELECNHVTGVHASAIDTNTEDLQLS